MEHNAERLTLVRKNPYHTASRNPKVSTDRKTYETLTSLAVSTGLPISEILRQIVSFAVDKIGIDVEGPP